MATPSKVKEPWELMKQLRLADTGELREVLERLQEHDLVAYIVLCAIIDSHKFRRTFVP